MRNAADSKSRSRITLVTRGPFGHEPKAIGSITEVELDSVYAVGDSEFDALTKALYFIIRRHLKNEGKIDKIQIDGQGVVSVRQEIEK